MCHQHHSLKTKIRIMQVLNTLSYVYYQLFKGFLFNLKFLSKLQLNPQILLLFFFYGTLSRISSGIHMGTGSFFICSDFSFFKLENCSYCLPCKFHTIWFVFSLLNRLGLSRQFECSVVDSSIAIQPFVCWLQ